MLTGPGDWDVDVFGGHGQEARHQQATWIGGTGGHIAGVY